MTASPTGQGELVPEAPLKQPDSSFQPGVSAVQREPGDQDVAVADDPSADNGQAKRPSRMIVVHIRPEDDWRETCRRIVQLAGQYEGQDSLRIRVSGQPMAMEFPNLRTSYCPELVSDVRRLPAISSVDAI
jgi:hypothetical protein